MVQFNRLRLSGFKSFVDATDLVIEPGTTGIVGPNGCGKSNLVEALRWVMGETSAKRMRGSEMEDVIFAGSSERPARNIAEVSLLLDARDGAPPPGYAGESELEVSRRIEREMGSLYRINGKEVRARDVQLLFADSATGAHSTALVSQGRIGAIINARPTDRRSLLEEAAGITGLHSRRHEAELRLKAAETNLARLDDVIKTLEAQLSGLKKQARQAVRYRTLADQIRRQEAVLLHIDSENGRLAQIEAKEALAAGEALVASETERVASATVEEAAAAEALPQLRQEEATAGAALQRLLLGREALERELAQVEASLGEAERRLAQLAGDRERAERQVADARSADEELNQELAQLIAADPAAAQAREEAKTALAEQETRVADEERALEALSSGLAADEARANEIARRLSDLAQRRQRLEEQAERAAAESTKLAEEAAADGRLLAAEEALRSAQSRQSEAKDAVDEAESTLARARADEQEARQLFQEAKSAHDRLAAEAAALAQLVEPSEQSLWAPMIDAVSVAPGFEAALGAALGDELSAPSDSAAPAHWRQLEEWSDTPALPDGVISLSLYVQGPEALSRRLSQIGVLERAEDGLSLQHQLKPGQRLVTQAGDLWRWDGYTVRAEAVTAAGQRLQQKNRLQELRQLLLVEAPKVASAEAALKEREAALAAANEAARASRSALEAAFQALSAANRAQSQATQFSAEREARRAALAEQSRRLAEDLSESENARQSAQQDQAALPDLAATRARVTEARARLAESRGLLTTCRSTLERLMREAELRRARQAAIGQERQSWQRRREDAERHLGELAERARATEGEIARLTKRPPVIAQEQAKLAEMIESATLQRRDAADRLALGETRLMEGQRALREAEQSLSRAREARVRAEGAVEHAAQALSLLAERVAEKIGVELDGLLAAAELDPSQELPPRAEVETRLQRLSRERENLGVVNLRAEVEAQELDTQLAGMMNEKNDLIAAIARLRQGISSLNREGRERLLAAFDAVNKHFGELFTRLFGGGRAHLSLTEAEDPLEAGLEIMASPPGKRLQVLSLLSGGEQALTALALLFAVFLTNPAPICVLDEVDAPLDDANVDRFCALVDHLAAQTGTRFLIITHHRLTMARMNRLYGVTMAERGVSQLVSVDLARAEEIRDRAA